MSKNCSRCGADAQTFSRLIEFQFANGDLIGAFSLCKQCYHESTQFVLNSEQIREAWAQRSVDFEHNCVTLPFYVAETLDKLLSGVAAKGPEET